MSRHKDKSPRSRDGGSTLAFSKSNTDMVSYEDLLIAQYLDELRKTKSDIRKKREVPASPYSQKLPHSDYGLTSKRRPMSATLPARPSSGSRKPKIDSKFIADPNLWDPATPRSEKPQERKLRNRPSSAPVRVKRGQRPLSAHSNMSWFYGRTPLRGWSGRSASIISGRKVKSQYRRQPHIIRCLAFKNGSRETMCRVAAPSMKIFLEACTERLGLPFAARRVFLEDGQELLDARDIPEEGEVYVSTGENFKNPFSNIKRNIIISNGAKWTLSGVLLPENGRKKKTKAKMSKRMKALVETSRVRIIVYRNGYATEPMEIVADLSKITEFLIACTSKLGLTTHAKVLYDWEGNEVKDLNETPILHDCLQPGSSPIMGPLWVSNGEAFSATGTLNYIKSIRVVIKSRLADAKKYRNELNYALSDEKEKVTISDILSMSDEELYNTLEIAEKEIEQLTETLEEMNSKLEVIQELQNKEETEGSNYRMSHIREFNFDHKLVGRKGLRLKVYENGTYDREHVFYFNLAGALKGIGNDKARLLQRLLDELSVISVMANPVNPKLAPVAKKIFDENGSEIKEVLKLEYDQEIWVSFGEQFISPFTYCLEACFEKAKGYTLMGETAVLREPLNLDEMKDKQSQSDWIATVGYPVYDYEEVKDQVQQSQISSLLEMSRLDIRSSYIQAMSDSTVVYYPEVICNRKMKKGNKQLWPSESQVWVINKKGYIRCKSLPQVCLGVSDIRMEMQVNDKQVSGFMVCLQKKMSGNRYQQWKFNPDATITSMAYPDMVLTYNNNKLGKEDNQRPEGLLPGQQVYLLLTEKLTKKDLSYQRFALKQERFDNLGQWKYNDATNKEWNKLALSWPVKENGELNEDYDWPMEGYLMPNAPKLHKGDKKLSLSGLVPLRLMAVKNGETDMRFAIPVVGPNITNSLKDSNKETGGKSKNKKQQQSKLLKSDVPVPETDNVEVDISIHCANLTVRELEFMMFLDSCTSLLNLPFAARRLFDKKGNEHFSLVSLRRDEIVFLSCGEPWMDPKMSKADQQRKVLLSQLSQDIAKIRQFCALRDPEKYVIEVESNLNPNTRIIINRQWNQDEDDMNVPITTEQESIISSKKSTSKVFAEEEEEDDSMTAHEISHQRSEQRLNKLKWPWERLVNVSQEAEYDDPDAYKYTDKEMYERYKPKAIPKISRDTLQRFVYEDGYIACSANRNLVLGVLEAEGRVSQVMLVKRRPDDINQRWVMKENGEIRSKHSSQSVLTAAMPANEPFAEDEKGRPLTFANCAATLQSRKTNTYGKAHQKWRYDAETGYIHAFSTNPYDKEITAANRADVCTYSIAQDSKIDQPGYLVEIPVTPIGDRKSVREITVCTSCARAMRGRFKLQKLPDKVEFYCAMGEAKKLKLQQIGSFRVLNGKVDLSTHEAELTLQTWEETLSQLRDEDNLRSISREINAAKTVTTVKILAYKNGEGRLRQGELICGSSIEGILNQCTYKLSLASAARRIFTEDGTMILEIEDLVDWAVENYKSLMADQLERLLNGKEDQTELAPIDEQNENEASQENEQRGDNYLRERGEGEGQDSPADGPSQSVDAAEVDQQEAHKVAKEREQLLSQIQIPPEEVILRYPIEVWVSSGGDFFPPEKVETKIENRKKKRAFRSAVSLELDIEKHMLRQMKARRYEEMNPGEFKSTRSSKQPVVIENNWQEPSVEEQMKHDTVHKLETHLAEVKSHQKEKIRSVSVNTNRRLYQQPNMKRVMVYPNGESIERATYVWGETMDQILENATSKLNMWGQARVIYDMEGKRIEKFDDLERDQTVCVSMGKAFTQPRGSHEHIEIKANWGRARKQHGPRATDLIIETPVNPKVNVDPFGPPDLALPPSSGTNSKKE